MKGGGVVMAKGFEKALQRALTRVGIKVDQGQLVQLTEALWEELTGREIRHRKSSVSEAVGVKGKELEPALKDVMRGLLWDARKPSEAIENLEQAVRRYGIRIVVTALVLFLDGMFTAMEEEKRAEVMENIAPQGNA